MPMRVLLPSHPPHDEASRMRCLLSIEVAWKAYIMWLTTEATNPI